MIQKVNRPAFLSLVATAKQTENDPGSSQGSGLFYDGPPPEQQQAEKQSSPETVPDEETTATKPKLSVVAHEKMGMSDVIKDLLDQQGHLCVYTGEPLIPGVNASLDHKTPTSRGGDNSIGNLQWVTKRINSFKNYLTHEEFVNLCGIISNRFGESLASKQNCMQEVCI